MFPLDPKVRGLCEKLVLWWGTHDPERRMSMDSAHELAGIVFVAQMILDTEKQWIAAQEPNSHES